MFPTPSTAASTGQIPTVRSAASALTRAGAREFSRQIANAVADRGLNMAFRGLGRAADAYLQYNRRFGGYIPGSNRTVSTRPRSPIVPARGKFGSGWMRSPRTPFASPILTPRGRAARGRGVFWGSPRFVTSGRFFKRRPRRGNYRRYMRSSRIPDRWAIYLHNYDFGDTIVGKGSWEAMNMRVPATGGENNAYNYSEAYLPSQWRELGLVEGNVSFERDQCSYVIRGWKTVVKFQFPTGIPTFNVEVFAVLYDSSKQAQSGKSSFGYVTDAIGQYRDTKMIPGRVQPQKDDIKILSYAKYRYVQKSRANVALNLSGDSNVYESSSAPVDLQERNLVMKKFFSTGLRVKQTWTGSGIKYTLGAANMHEYQIKFVLRVPVKGITLDATSFPPSNVSKWNAFYTMYYTTSTFVWLKTDSFTESTLPAVP